MALPVFRDDPALVLELIRINPMVFIYASDRLRHDPDFNMQAVQCNPGVLRFLIWKFRNSLPVVVTAVWIRPGVISYASPTLQTHPDVLNAYRWRMEQLQASRINAHQWKKRNSVWR